MAIWDSLLEGSKAGRAPKCIVGVLVVLLWTQMVKTGFAGVQGLGLSGELSGENSARAGLGDGSSVVGTLSWHLRYVQIQHPREVQARGSVADCG